MNVTKRIGLTILIFATVILVDSSPALADTLCFKSGLHFGECPVGDRYTGNIVGSGTGSFLEAGSEKMGCVEKRRGLGATIINEANHKGFFILVDAGDYKLTECTGVCEEATNINPILWLYSALTLESFLIEDGAGRMKLRWDGCIFGITCEYTLVNTKQLLTIAGDTGTASSVPLERTGGSFLCPNNNMSLDSTWLLTTEAGGTPLYIAALP